MTRLSSSSLRPRAGLLDCSFHYVGILVDYTWNVSVRVCQCPESSWPDGPAYRSGHREFGGPASGQLEELEVQIRFLAD